jgi:uncharacterized protein YutE (UPF0331/DUF86 family)
MPSEIVTKKLEQIDTLLKELNGFTASSFEEFEKNIADLRASERVFQLIVDTASDINAELLLEKGHRAPDTYRQSFLFLAEAGIIGASLAQQLAESAITRNILVHEYDVDEDNEKFYNDAKKFLPIFREYLKAIVNYKKS